MNYLTNFGFSEYEIELLENSLGDTAYDIFYNRRSRVEDIINYFKRLGIRNIKDIVFNYEFIFTFPFETVKEMVENCKDSDIISKINNNVENIDLLINNKDWFKISFYIDNEMYFWEDINVIINNSWRYYKCLK